MKSMLPPSFLQGGGGLDPAPPPPPPDPLLNQLDI